MNVGGTGVIAAVAYGGEPGGYGGAASRTNSGDGLTVAGLNGARGRWGWWRLWLAAGVLVVPWGLFAVAVIPEPTTGHRDGSFVVISLIYALILTPLGLCVLWPDRHHPRS
jgi:hypothetical protein